MSEGPDKAEQKKPLRVAIVGTAPASYRLAPYDDPDWEVWSLSRLYGAIPRWDRWFELHRLEEVCKTWVGVPNEAAEARARQEYFAWMQKQEKPIYLQELRPDIAPSGIRYPIEDILQMFPRRYFNNSIAYMIALAIKEQAKSIGIWGVDMALHEEYREQRPSCEYFIGVADGLGIECIVPPECNLMKSRKLYAYEPEDEFGLMARAKQNELKNRINTVEAQLEQGKSALHQLKGAEEMLEHMALNWE